MKYLKKFSTDSARVEYEDSENYLEPYVSYVEGDNTVHYNKPKFFCKLTLNDDSTVELEGSGELTQAMVSDQYKNTLVSAEIGELCTSIGDAAFYYCSNLNSVIIPNSVTSIGQAIFQNCYELTSVTIPSSIMSINNNTFHNCIGLTSVTIPDSVINIGERAFYVCYGLAQVEIPDSVTSIGKDAFGNCTGVTTVTIGSGVTSIGRNAFSSCNSLANITINAVDPPTMDGYSLPGSYPIYVPNTSVDTYKAASGWSNYASRIQAIQ